MAFGWTQLQDANAVVVLLDYLGSSTYAFVALVGLIALGIVFGLPKLEARPPRRGRSNARRGRAGDR
jgi:hypothetical protein